MTDLERTLRLRRSVCHTPAQLLELLERRLATQPRPVSLRLLLSSGHTLEGQLVRFADGQLLLSQAQELHWVSHSQLAALTLLQAPDWIAELTGGQVLAAEGEAPGRLQLRREAESLATKVAPTELEVAWDSLGEQEQSARHLQRLLRDIGALWDAWGRDEMSRQARDSVRRVLIESGSEASAVHMADGVCRIRVQQGPDGWVAFPSARLREQWEKQL